MYTIFELSFDKKSRAIRLLYSVLHGDKRFLSNSIRNLIRDKNIDIDWQLKQKLSSSSSISLSNNSTTLLIDPGIQSSVNGDSPSESVVERNSPTVSQMSEIKSSSVVPGFNSDMPMDTNE
jgi:hypothetical protein